MSVSTQTRTNLKKLGCLFESFLGALFLDFNKNTDDFLIWLEKWQIYLENIAR